MMVSSKNGAHTIPQANILIPLLSAPQNAPFIIKIRVQKSNCDSGITSVHKARYPSDNQAINIDARLWKNDSDPDVTHDGSF